MIPTELCSKLQPLRDALLVSNEVDQIKYQSNSNVILQKKCQFHRLQQCRCHCCKYSLFIRFDNVDKDDKTELVLTEPVAELEGVGAMFPPWRLELGLGID